MTTVISKKGQIVLPSSVREQMHLEPGQDFEVFIEDEDTITLRRISRRPNQGLIDHLLACPYFYFGKLAKGFWGLFQGELTSVGGIDRGLALAMSASELPQNVFRGGCAGW